MMKDVRDLYPEDLPVECIQECSASGDVYDAVEYWQQQLNFVVDRTNAISYLESTGAWDKSDLEESDDTSLAQRILWIACCDFKEGNDMFYLGD